MRLGALALDEQPAAASYYDVQDVEKPRADAAGRRRLRAPSADSSTTSSDDEDDEDDDDVSEGSDSRLAASDSSVHAATAALGTLQLTAKSRQELVKQVERSCERKAVQAVTSSGAYKALCQTLQSARQDADAQLRRVNADSARSGEQMDVLREQQQLEREASAKLQQVSTYSPWR